MIVFAKYKENPEQMDILAVLGNGKTTTGKRYFLELNKRYDKLTPQQRDHFLHADLVAQKQMAFLAVCKTYSFIRDFVLEVLREKSLVFDDCITEGDYISFLRQKQDAHAEMDQLTEKSLSKIKQVVFKMLEQASIINNIKDRIIQTQILDAKTIDVIINDDPEWLKIFLLSDADIENINTKI